LLHGVSLGAMSYQFPRVADRGAQLKQLLSSTAARAAVIRASCSTTAAPAGTCLRRPPRVRPSRQCLPVETWHVASVGLVSSFQRWPSALPARSCSLPRRKIRNIARR
jgi:hypothetical protein